MKKDLKKKKLKGMTLLEVIVAMVVLIFVSVILVQCAVAVVKSVRTSRVVVKKVNAQTSSVENRIITTPDADSASLVLTFDGKTYDPIPLEKHTADSSESAVDIPEAEQRCGDLKYFVID